MEPRERMRWGDVLKGLLAVRVAEAADRALRKRQESTEAGRKGGAAGSATIPAARPGSGAHGAAPAASTAERAEMGRPSGAVEIAKRAFKEFGSDNGTLMAAAVAFYFVLSIIPLVAVGISIFGHVLGSNAEAQRQVFTYLQQFFPGQGQVLRDAIQKLIEARETIGIVAILSLLLTATGGFATLETAINVTWGAPNRNFFWNKVFALGALLGIGLLFSLTFGITAVVQFAGTLPMLGWLAQNWGLKILGVVLPLVISTGMFTLIYRFFPNVKPQSWRPALIAGVVTAVLWEVFKWGYTIYSHHVGDQNATYGTLGGFVGLIMWIYYSSVLMLLGSELAWVLEGCPEGKQRGQKAPGRDSTHPAVSK